MKFDREIYFDMVRERPFAGSLTQEQVDGQDFILGVWEDGTTDTDDLRWLANALAQAAHETGMRMWPIEEYHGAEQPYGKPDPVTKQCYWGRGLIQITHKENYERADRELELTGDESCVWHPENALDPQIASAIMFQGMSEGWFRSSGGVPNTFAKYFNDTRNDIFEAREIINGDKNTVPSWSGGKSIGHLIESYHNDFLAALDASFRKSDLEPDRDIEITLVVKAPPGVKVVVDVENVNE